MGELEVLNMLTDTVKNIDKICMMRESRGYSEAVNGEDYGRGSSYADRRRDSMGRYSRDGGGNMGVDFSPRRDGRGGYSRNDDRSDMMQYIRTAIDKAPDRDRESVMRFMRELENA